MGPCSYVVYIFCIYIYVGLEVVPMSLLWAYV